MQPVAGPLAGPQAKPSHLLVSWIWQSKVWASLWSPPPARVVWPLRPLAGVGAPAAGAASGMAGSSPAGGPGHGGVSLPPPSVYNESGGDSAGSVREGVEWVMVVVLHAAPAPLDKGPSSEESGPMLPILPSTHENDSWPRDQILGTAWLVTLGASSAKYKASGSFFEVGNARLLNKAYAS